MNECLTSVEHNELAHHEAVINRGLTTFVEVGHALLAIRDARLYRERYETFEIYCRERWGMVRRHANRLIAAAEVVTNLGPIGPIPATESQARQLAALSPIAQREAWQLAVETAPNGKVTAAHAQNVVESMRSGLLTDAARADPALAQRVLETAKELKADRLNSTVTYHNQPAIHATRGAVPLAGTSHVYTVKKLLWPEAVEDMLAGLLIGRSLHVCCGKSKLGDVRLDLLEPDADIHADANAIPLPDKSFDTVLCDPPYNGEYQWNHDMLSELARLARSRIVFQHWFLPADADGGYHKAHSFQLEHIYVWQPRTYFGRAQLISVFGRNDHGMAQ